MKSTALHHSRCGVLLLAATLGACWICALAPAAHAQERIGALTARSLKREWAQTQKHRHRFQLPATTDSRRLGAILQGALGNGQILSREHRHGRPTRRTGPLNEQLTYDWRGSQSGVLDVSLREMGKLPGKRRLVKVSYRRRHDNPPAARGRGSTSKLVVLTPRGGFVVPYAAEEEYRLKARLFKTTPSKRLARPSVRLLPNPKPRGGATWYRFPAYIRSAGANRVSAPTTPVPQAAPRSRHPKAAPPADKPPMAQGSYGDHNWFGRLRN